MAVHRRPPSRGSRRGRATARGGERRRRAGPSRRWPTSSLRVIDIWEGEPERRSRAPECSLERALKLGVGRDRAGAAAPRSPGPSSPSAGTSRPATGSRLSLPLIEGRDALHYVVGAVAARRSATAAGGRRRRGDRVARLRQAASGSATASSRTRARLTLGRLAAARGDWAAAQQHALAHLDACAEGGHATFVPGCLDALAEVAAGLGATRTRCGCSPPPSAPAPRSASSASRRRRSTGPPSRAGCAKRSAPTPTRPRAPRAPS